MAKPIITETTEPRPGTKPPRPTTRAVRAKNSMPMPVSEPTAFCARRVKEAGKADDQARRAHRRGRSVTLTLMPPCRAALRFPPTARTCQPKRDWRNITRIAGRHEEEDPEADRHSGTAQIRSSPRHRRSGARGDGDESPLRRERVDPADRDRRSERRQQRAAAGEPGQRAVDDADRRAGREARARARRRPAGSGCGSNKAR